MEKSKPASASPEKTAPAVEVAYDGGGGYRHEQPPPAYYQSQYSDGNQPHPAPPPPPPRAYVVEQREVVVVYYAFETKQDRMRFIRKVYAILSLQLLFTAGLTAVFVLEESVQKYVAAHSYLLILALVLYFVVYIALICSSTLRRSFPINLVMLVLLTLALSFLVAVITASYNTDVVLVSLGITAAVCFIVTIFAMQTKFDFTVCGTLLMVLSLILIVLAIVGIFWRNRIYHVIYACIGALVFTLFLAFDTQLIMGGKRIQLSPDEYVLGAIQLYTDIVMIFLYMLNIVSFAGGSSN